LDPIEVLRRAATAAMIGDYEAALVDYIWLHEHSVAHSSSFSGVRRSFALYYWMDLAKVYPNALAALDAAHQKITDRFLAGEPDISLLLDLCAMNDCKGTPEVTSAIFSQMAQQFPSTAEFYRKARPSMFGGGTLRNA
jgi:hypothetical protein